MKCEEIKKQSAQYLLDEASLSLEQLSETRNHLLACSDCRKELVALRKTLEALNQTGQVEDTEERIARVMNLVKTGGLPLILKSPLPKGSSQAERWELSREPIIIGRAKKCTIRIQDKNVSRQHCRIEPVPEGGYKLIDLSSANGTFVNGSKISEVTLSGGEMIKIGGYEIEVGQPIKPSPVPSAAITPKDVTAPEPEIKFIPIPTIPETGPSLSPEASLASDGKRPAPDTTKPPPPEETVPSPPSVPSPKNLPRAMVDKITGFTKKTAPPLPKTSFKRISPWIIWGTIGTVIIFAFIIILSHEAGKNQKKAALESEISRVEPGLIYKDDKKAGKKPVKITEAERQRLAEEASKEVIRKLEEEKQRAREAAEKARLEKEKQRQEAAAARLRQLEEKRCQRKEEYQRREQAEQRKREAERKYLAQEEKRFNKLLPLYKDLIKTFQFSKAVKLCEDFLKDSKNRAYRDKVTICSDDAQCQYQIFDYLIKQLTEKEKRTKLDLGLIKIWVVKADETVVEGTVEKRPDTWCSKRWVEIKPEVIYNLFNIDKLDDKSWFDLAVFCYDHSLIAKADSLLIRYYKRHSEQKDRINNLLARKKDVPIPAGGFVVYHGRWITPEEKSWLAKGYIKHNGKWMTYDEVMLAKGYVKYDGKWVTQAKAERLRAARERLLAQRNLLAPKGIIDKPGADSEQLPWDQHRTKESDHYIVKTNLSKDALNDIVYVMECLHYNHKKNFNLTKESTNKLSVYVFRTGQEYCANGGPRGSGGVFMGGGRGGNRLMTFYQRGTTGVLLHEGTHQFVALAIRASPPLWVNEGLATYYECSRFDGKKLKTNLINQGRCSMIKQMISGNRHMPLRNFINVMQSRYNIQCYAQGWSLVYFLINGKGGRYTQKFAKYWDELKKGECTQGNPNPKVHISMFEQIFKIPLDDMEVEWKEYIMSLK